VAFRDGGLPVPPPGEAYVLIERRLAPELLDAQMAG
jgi:hypothetical protein